LWDHAVPMQAQERYAASGLALHKRWQRSAFAPRLFTRADFCDAASTFPLRSAARNQRQWWRVRGRFDREVERLWYHRDLSQAAQAPMFSVVADHAPEVERLTRHVELADVPQTELARLAELEATISPREPQSRAQLYSLLVSRGWTYAEVRASVDALLQSGRLAEVDGLIQSVVGVVTT